MIRPAIALQRTFEPAFRRLSKLAALDAGAETALAAAIDDAVLVQARRELLSEGKAVGPFRLIVAGWAARVRVLADGRRQFLSFLLPGDLIGHCGQSHPIASSTIAALTDVTVCTPPAPGAFAGLTEAYHISRALEEAHLLAHITRLGRFNAHERIRDLLLELNERLTLNGMAVRDSFDLPLTQEMLGDALGLTSVHVNRMVQTARRDGDLQWRGGRVTLTDPAVLARKVGRTVVRVTGGATEVS